MIGELNLATLKLEGELFKINMILDKETNLNEYVKFRKRKDDITVQLFQYRNIIEQFQKDEKLKQIKRRMMR